MKNISIAILGASGYTGAELIRTLNRHPHARIVALSADSQAGKTIVDIYPHLDGLELPLLQKIEDIDFSGIDFVFCCLPHAASQAVIAGLPAHVKIIDLSADFRLRDTALYAKWYGHAHQASDLQKSAIYGLTEHARAAIKTARLVANPGCYPTCSLLPLIPLLNARAIALENIIIDAKSGVSGAGRSAKPELLFAEITEGVSAYGIGSHRHVPEIEQGLSDAAGASVTVSFTPHLIPMARGMLATIYVTLAPGNTADSLRGILMGAYKNESFIHVLPAGQVPKTHAVRGTNHCAIGVFSDHAPNRAILVSAIDNLGKGASGQAVQNMNIMFGFPEITGLDDRAVFP